MLYMTAYRLLHLWCRFTEIFDKGSALENYHLLLRRLKNVYQIKKADFEVGYKKFAKMRGFNTFNDLSYHRRGFIECWAEPGFHRFWQVWNPGIAYFVYRLFLGLGGSKRWLIPAFLSFLFCGIIHTVIVFPFLGWSFSVIGAFICFAVLTIVSRKMSRLLHQEKWPAIANIVINIGLVVGSFDIGFRIDRFFC